MYRPHQPLRGRRSVDSLPIPFHPRGMHAWAGTHTLASIPVRGVHSMVPRVEDEYMVVRDGTLVVGAGRNSTTQAEQADTPPTPDDHPPSTHASPKFLPHGIQPSQHTGTSDRLSWSSQDAVKASHEPVSREYALTTHAEQKNGGSGGGGSGEGKLRQLNHDGEDTGSHHHSQLAKNYTSLQKELVQAKLKIGDLERRANNVAAFSGQRVADLHKELTRVRTKLRRTLVQTDTSEFDADLVVAELAKNDLQYAKATAVQTDQSSLRSEDTRFLTDNVLVREVRSRFAEIENETDLHRFQTFFDNLKQVLNDQTRLGLPGITLKYISTPQQDVAPVLANIVPVTAKKAESPAGSTVSLTSEERKQRRREMRERREAIAARNVPGVDQGMSRLHDVSAIVPDSAAPVSRASRTLQSLRDFRHRGSAPNLTTPSPDQSPIHAEIESPSISREISSPGLQQGAQSVERELWPRYRHIDQDVDPSIDTTEPPRHGTPGDGGGPGTKGNHEPMIISARLGHLMKASKRPASRSPGSRATVSTSALDTAT